jgi:hypothetical protein
MGFNGGLYPDLAKKDATPAIDSIAVKISILALGIPPAHFRVPPRPGISGEFGNSRCEALWAGTSPAAIG